MGRIKKLLLHIIYFEGPRPKGCTCPRLPWQRKPSCLYHMDPWLKERYFSPTIPVTDLPPPGPSNIVVRTPNPLKAPERVEEQ